MEGCRRCPPAPQVLSCLSRKREYTLKAWKLVDPEMIRPPESPPPTLFPSGSRGPRNANSVATRPLHVPFDANDKGTISSGTGSVVTSQNNGVLTTEQSTLRVTVARYVDEEGDHNPETNFVGRNIVSRTVASSTSPHITPIDHPDG
ncbi:unnamed protein product [Mesocestoides corti]|uniref:Uncharacterized protein n=2 Tax=Mesocestoides corti TaxID=53468 RepID=A0A0R3UJ95_MESCO|nr:unnamed protein product [Mesocestoides corti]